VSIRRTTAASLGLALLVAPAVIGLSATQALAEGSFAGSTPSGQLTSTSFTVTANATKKGTKLTLTGPGSYSASKSSPAGTFDSNTATIKIDASVGGLPNGTFTASISNGESRTFYSNFAPSTPSGFTADTTAGDANDVTLQWNRGSEPDLLGYKITDGGGNVRNVGLDACSGSSCTYPLYYDNPKPGTYDYSYQLSAIRSGGCASGTCAPVESSKTDTRTATLVTPKPAPSPTPSPSAGGGSTTTGGTTGSGTTGGTTAGGTSTGGTTGSGTTGGTTTGAGTSGGTASTSGGTTVSPGPAPTLPALDSAALERRALALNFNAFSPSLGIPKLPPLPATLPDIAGAAQPLPSGTFDPSLPYADQSETTKTTSLIADPIGSIRSIDTEQLAKSLAVALILILMAAHLRRWIGAHVED
jgi:hypothetical protein